MAAQLNIEVSEPHTVTEQVAKHDGWVYRLIVDKKAHMWDLTRREIVYVELGDAESGPLGMSEELSAFIMFCGEGMGWPDIKDEIARFLADLESECNDD